MTEEPIECIGTLKLCKFGEMLTGELASFQIKTEVFLEILSHLDPHFCFRPCSSVSKGNMNNDIHVHKTAGNRYSHSR